MRGVVAVQRAVLAAEVEALRGEDRERQARQALAACHHRAARTRRIARLKALFSRTAQGALFSLAVFLAGWPGVCCVCDLLCQGCLVRTVPASPPPFLPVCVPASHVLTARCACCRPPLCRRACSI